MDRGWYVRLVLVVGLGVYAALVFWPSLAGSDGAWFRPPAWVTEHFTRRIALGLDIQGGLRLVYEVEVEEAVQDRRDLRAQQMLERLCQQFEICDEDEPATTEQLERTRERVRITGIERDAFRVTFQDAADAAALDRDLVQSFGDLRERARTDTSVTLELRAESLDHLREQAVEQARETIANRIDELGLREAGVMTREDTIIVELPGASEEQFDQIRAVISQTARLEFKIVDDEATFLDGVELPSGIARAVETQPVGEGRAPAMSRYLTASGEGARQRLQDFIATLRQNGTIPDGRELLVGEADLGLDEEELEPGAPRPEVWRTYTVHSRADVTGDAIDDAQVMPDPQTGNPVVLITFNSAGARAFERLTGANVQRRMAIVLDDRVQSAPVIQSRIGGGRCQITLGGNRSYNEILNEASDLVVVLRAGALPAPIRPANEQLVGPSLGADAVQQGLTGALVGILVVLAFMAVYYEVAGLVADGMVLLNVLFMLAILAAFEATLTLPGIAGIALSVGMAVDANVLITERIREELRLGKAPSSAVTLGFDKALWSILDSQMTTFIAGVVLFQYGTGPIKGFAVTLMIGIVTSVFTGVFCSKVVFDWLVRGLKVTRLRVG